VEKTTMRERSLIPEEKNMKKLLRPLLTRRNFAVATAAALIAPYLSGGSAWATEWKPIPGGLTRISAGSSTNVWGVNAAGNIFAYTQDDANPWVQIPGGLKDIAAGADGTVWGVDSAGQIFRYLRT
jgi:hypothetical protein